MPRPRKAPRLWLRPARKEANGSIRPASWIIKDGGKHISTGCGEGDSEEASRKLASYILGQYQIPDTERDISDIDISDVINIYVRDCGPQQVRQKQLAERCSRLLDFWGRKKLSEVTGRTCREYAAHRGNPGGARRDLEDLRAAINYHAKEGLHRGVVRVVLPEKGQARDRWLTRSEAARLLWACWRTREVQRRHRGDDKGQDLPTSKYPLRHIARFILLGLYTGSRAGAISRASFIPAIGHSYLDLQAGIFYRRAEGAKETKKRQPPVPLPPRLLAHLRRWSETGASNTHVVEWAGLPVSSVKTGFGRAVELAGLDGRVTPHTLRHTGVTWAMQAGHSIWDVAAYFGMSPQMVERVYGHHHPDYLRSVAAGMGSAGRAATNMPPKQRDRTRTKANG